MSFFHSHARKGSDYFIDPMIAESSRPPMRSQPVALNLSYQQLPTPHRLIARQP